MLRQRGNGGGRPATGLPLCGCCLLPDCSSTGGTLTVIVGGSVNCVVRRYGLSRGIADVEHSEFGANRGLVNAGPP
jgi:hypothetical protein